MAGFLDNFRWPECECMDWGERRNALASVVAGFLVSDLTERAVERFTYSEARKYLGSDRVFIILLLYTTAMDLRGFPKNMAFTI